MAHFVWVPCPAGKYVMYSYSFAGTQEHPTLAAFSCRKMWSRRQVINCFCWGGSWGPTASLLTPSVPLGSWLLFVAPCLCLPLAGLRLYEESLRSSMLSWDGQAPGWVPSRSGDRRGCRCNGHLLGFEVVGSGGKWQRSRYVKILKEKGRVVRRRLQGWRETSTWLGKAASRNSVAELCWTQGTYFCGPRLI